MSERPTPETDAKASDIIGFFSCATVPADFAKRLECERDEAQKELDAIRAVFGHGANDADWKPGTAIAEAVEKVMRERNEARKLACLYKDQFYAVSMPTVKPPKFSWEEGYIQ